MSRFAFCNTVNPRYLTSLNSINVLLKFGILVGGGRGVNFTQIFHFILILRFWNIFLEHFLRQIPRYICIAINSSIELLYIDLNLFKKLLRFFTETMQSTELCFHPPPSPFTETFFHQSWTVFAFKSLQNIILNVQNIISD